MTYQAVTVTLYDCKCDKCGWEWRSRKSELPTHCPHEKCPNPAKWNSEGVKRDTMPQVEVKSDFNFGA